MPTKSSTNLKDDDELSFLDDEKSSNSDDVEDISGSGDISKTKEVTSVRQRKTPEKSDL